MLDVGGVVENTQMTWGTSQTSWSIYSSGKDGCVTSTKNGLLQIVKRTLKEKADSKNE